MKTPLVQKVSWLITLSIVLYFTKAKYQSPYEQERVKVEEMFKKLPMNSDLSKLDLLDWPLADEITEEKLKKICYDVMVDITPSFIPANQSTYVPPPGEERSLQMERVVRYAPTLFTEEGMKYMTLIQCPFKEIEFYLTQGNDTNHVFCLTKDREDFIFYFRSGLHKISY